MIQCKTVIEKVLNILTGSEALKDIDFMSEFPSKRRDIPLRKVTVSVGVESLKLTPADDALVISPGKATETLKIKLTVCTPRDITGLVCYDALDRIVNVLKTLRSSYAVTSIETGQIKYSSSINGLCLPVDITVFEENAY